MPSAGTDVKHMWDFTEVVLHDLAADICGVAVWNIAFDNRNTGIGVALIFMHLDILFP